MTENEFLNEMEWFLEYYKIEMKGVRAKVWYEIFRKYSKEQFHRGLISHIRTDETTFFPSPGKINTQMQRIAVLFDVKEYRKKLGFKDE